MFHTRNDFFWKNFLTIKLQLGPLSEAEQALLHQRDLLERRLDVYVG